MRVLSLLLLLSLASLLPRTFAQSAKHTQAKMRPCSSPEYHRFDFWLGCWEVHNPQGKVVGHNDVTSIQGGCIVLENWKSARGYETGTSFNFFDNRDHKWHQTYYDNSGNFGNYPPMAGDLQGGKMVLITALGEKPISRWTWYVLSPGKVRQMAEQSTDQGKTWTITWDSVYVKQ